MEDRPSAPGEPAPTGVDVASYPPPPRALLLVALCAAVALVTGWNAFWFLTDDAFIAFRYVANHHDGHGFVWNLPPFRPVEGYTSFAWVALLRTWWGLTGMAPPDAANGLSLACGATSLWIVARGLLRMRFPDDRPGLRLGLLVLVLAGVLSNRTVLTWLSSGLETALFNLGVIGWVFAALAPRAAPDDGDPRPSLAGGGSIASYRGMALWAALGGLTRPDGMLLVAATGALGAWELARTGRRSSWKIRTMAGALCAVPAATVGAHMLWRHSFYGEWLPNTYYAKHVAAWPESGARYLASFVVEYGLWAWLPLLVIVGLRAVRSRAKGGTPAGPRLDPGLVRALLVLGVLCFHAGYYAFVIGGDHFEYRVLSHLPPLLFVGAAWLALRCWAARSHRLVAMALLVLLALPVQWVHWNRTRDLDTREQTHVLHVAIADAFPPPLRSVMRRWDAWQRWLIVHHVGMRHQEHKVFYEEQARIHPTRAQGASIPWEGRPVAVADTVGVPGWVYPNVAILDLFGLNDHVIARNPTAPGAERLMAHDRRPPPGYLNCFKPNLRLEAVGPVPLPRPDGPLTDDEIRACEQRRW